MSVAESTTKTSLCALQLLIAVGMVAAAIFSADQKQVITLEDDGATRGWPLSVAEEAFRRRPRDLTPDEVDRYGTLPPDDRREYRAKWDSRMSR